MHLAVGAAQLKSNAWKHLGFPADRAAQKQRVEAVVVVVVVVRSRSGPLKNGESSALAPPEDGLGPSYYFQSIFITLSG